MPDNSTDPPEATHRPAVLKFNAHNHPVTVVADVAEAPRVHSALDVSTLTARSMVQAGPVALIFDDPATAHLWAAAFSVLAADMDVNAAHAADLRNTEMHASADYDDPNDELADAGPNADYDDHGRVDL